MHSSQYILYPFSCLSVHAHHHELPHKLMRGQCTRHSTLCTRFSASQCMHITMNCHPSSCAAARAAGARLRLVVERVMEVLGEEVVQTPGFNNLKLIMWVYCTHFVHLHCLKLISWVYSTRVVLFQC